MARYARSWELCGKKTLVVSVQRHNDLKPIGLQLFPLLMWSWPGALCSPYALCELRGPRLRGLRWESLLSVEDC